MSDCMLFETFQSKYYTSYIIKYLPGPVKSIFFKHEVKHLELVQKNVKLTEDLKNLSGFREVFSLQYAVTVISFLERILMAFSLNTWVSI